MDTTLLIQGKLDSRVYDFYCYHYQDYPKIFSTWYNNDVSNSIWVNNLYLKDVHKYNTKVLLNDYPPDIFISKEQNRHLQIWSTIKGLQQVKTEKVIKLRGDEVYSNLNTIKIHENKITCAPIYFKSWRQYPYHISDHIIAGYTENLEKMFYGALSKIYDKDEINRITPEYKNLVTETLLGISYLEEKFNIQFDFSDKSRQIFVENFDILNLESLKPYCVTANYIKKTWYSDFIPEHNDSISNIEDSYIIRRKKI